MSTFIDIDGSLLEGGGQILRISISLSAILALPLRVYNIRAGRSKPGLAAQHLKGIQLVADMCHAKLKGANIGSTEIEFAPGKIRGGYYCADTHTAGSISLLLQVALPCALMADGPVTLDLKGGTNVDMAPQIDYMLHVFRPLLKNFSADFSLHIHKRGYFPKGGGHVTVEVSPIRTLRNINLTNPGEVIAVRGSSFVEGYAPFELAKKMAQGAKKVLTPLTNNCCQLDIKYYKEDISMDKARQGDGTGIILWSELSSPCVLGAGGLWRRGRDPWDVGAAVGQAMADEIRSGSCLDTHAQDQLILYMALSSGHSSVKVGEVTMHTKTAIHIAELIAKIKFKVEPDGANNIIECTGLGFINKNWAPE